MVEARQIKAVMSASELAIRLEKRRVTRDSLVQQISCLQPFRFCGTAKARQKKSFGARVEIERSDVTCWRVLDRALFTWRKLDLELVGDRLRDLTLNSKNVRKIAIISLPPYLSIDARID